MVASPRARHLALTLLIVALAGCGGGDGFKGVDVPRPDFGPDLRGTADAGEPGERVWEIILQNQPGALLSIWAGADDDVWLSAAAPTGEGAEALHFDGRSWTRLRVDVGAGSDVRHELWWVFSADGKTLWFCGNHGLLLRYDRETDTFERVETGTDATLYGMWGAGPDEIWVAGGFVLPEDGPGVLLRIREGRAEMVDDLPDTIPGDAAFFKVWGSAADRAWVIGEHGTELTWDGSAWTHRTLAGEPRLVTLHGSGAGDRVVVGGFGQAVLLESSDGETWVDESPEGVALLNGVFVRGSLAFATGMRGTTLVRDGGVWSEVDLPEIPADWHAAWIDEAGAGYAAGGSLASASALDRGAFARYGVPTGVTPAEPATVYHAIGDARPVVGDAGADEAARDAFVADADGDGTSGPGVDDVASDDATNSDTGPASPDPGRDDVAGSDPGTTNDPGATPDPGVQSDPGTDPDPDPDAGTDPDPGVTPGPGPADEGPADGGPVTMDAGPDSFPLEIGIFDYEAGYIEGSRVTEVEIVQGPQGGIHVELVARVALPGDIRTFVTVPTVNGRITIGADQVGGLQGQSFLLGRISDGLYEMAPITVFFDDRLAAPHVNKRATIWVELTLEDGRVASREVTGTLIDEF